MRCRLYMLVMVLAVLTPSLAFCRSERHDYRERTRLRLQLKRHVEPIDTWRPWRTYPHFKLDVF